MANQYRGEIEFTAGEETYKLSFSANAMVEVEDVLGRDFSQVIEEMKAEKVKLSDLRLMFWQGLRDNKPDTTLDDVKVILSKMKPADLGRLVAGAMIASMPDAQEVADKGDSSPPKAAPKKAGTGTGS